MAYTVVDYQTKKAFKQAFDSGQEIEVYQPGPFGPKVPDGAAYLEGPHYPKPHRWYCKVMVEGGVVTKVMK